MRRHDVAAPRIVLFAVYSVFGGRLRHVVLQSTNVPGLLQRPVDGRQGHLQHNNPHGGVVDRGRRRLPGRAAVLRLASCGHSQR